MLWGGEGVGGVGQQDPLYLCGGRDPWAAPVEEVVVVGGGGGSSSSVVVLA